MFRDLKIDKCDWQSLDFRLEATLNALPDMTELHLYWSGNGVTMKSWKGYAVQPRKIKLRKLHLHGAVSSKQPLKGSEVAKQTR